LLSNIVPDELDQEIARQGYGFVRYADDANI
jgi:RNA-directed DNA polymerase